MENSMTIDAKMDIEDLTHNDESKIKPFSLLSRETRGILRPASRDLLRISGDKTAIDFPFFSSIDANHYPADYGYRMNYEGLLQKYSGFKQVNWEFLDSRKTKKMLGTMTLLGDFLKIAEIDLSSRGGVNHIESLNFSSPCDEKVIDAIVNFIIKYGPLLFCSEHKFCFIQTPFLNEKFNKCAWDFREYTEDYINLSRLFYLLALCYPPLMQGVKKHQTKVYEIKERLEEIITKFSIAKVLFNNIRDCAGANQWFLIGIVSNVLDVLTQARAKGSNLTPSDNNRLLSSVEMLTMVMDHALTQLMGSNPLTFVFHTGGGKGVADINNFPNIDIFYDTGLGVGRILLLQFCQALTGSGRLVVCSECFKPYLRKKNIIRGRNYCPDCDRRKKKEEDNDTDTDTD
jgi:hypothetical protein